MNQNFDRVSNTNINEYIQATKGLSDKCIGCAVCFSPNHQIISYKYPKQQTHSSYVGYFKDHLKQNAQNAFNSKKVVKVSFDYDKVREQMRKQKRDSIINEGDQGSKEKLIQNQKLLGSYATTNRDFHQVGLKKEGKDAETLRKNILDKHREGNIVQVPVSCFLGNTSYKDKFDQYENVMKM